jgi:hypothetical protein
MQVKGKRMDIIQQLYIYPEINDRVSRLQSEITTVLVDRQMLSAVAVSTKHKTIFTQPDVVLNNVIEGCDMQIESKQKEIKRLLEYQKIINERLLCLDPFERSIVQMRYFNRNTWKDIAHTTRLNLSYLYRISSMIKHKISE